MNIDPSGSGLPVLSAGEVTETLYGLYASAAAHDLPAAKVPAVFLWGAPGIGKSQAVRQAAEKLQKKTGKKVHVTDIRLLLFSPVDLRGLPVADKENECALWLKPRVFDMNSSEDVINILLLDELSAAPQSMQAAAYQICLDRRIGEHLLPENCFVIAAGNRMTDRSVAYQMPKALCSRMMHFMVTADFASWKQWALETGIDHRVIGFLEKYPDRLAVEPKSADIAYPSPRTWAFVSDLLQMETGLSAAAMVPMTAGCVGMESALEFRRYCEIASTLPDLEAIFSGTCKVYPKTADALYALCSAVAYYALRQKERLSKSELEHMLAYITKFPADYASMLLQDLQADEDLRTYLIGSPAFKAWLKKHPGFTAGSAKNTRKKNG